MRGIVADRGRLEPVAVQVPLECEGVAIGCNKTVDLRKRRRLAFPEIGPEDSALFDHGVSALGDVLAQRRVFRLRRRFKALTLDVELPAMKNTTQAPVFEAAEGQIDARP